jgi:uncharacterized iron-regulated membrane protein
MWFVLVALAVIALLAGYVMWRDRRRGPGGGRAAETGEGRAAADSAQLSRGANDVGGF